MDIENILPEVTVDTFFQTDIRVARVLSAEPLADARKPAFKLQLDFGHLGVKWSSAQLTALYTPETLVGRLVLAAVNFPARRVAGFKSEVLTLGVPDEAGATILLTLEREAPLGSRVF